MEQQERNNNNKCSPTTTRIRDPTKSLAHQLKTHTNQFGSNLFGAQEKNEPKNFGIEKLLSRPNVVVTKFDWKNVPRKFGRPKKNTKKSRTNQFCGKRFGLKLRI